MDRNQRQVEIAKFVSEAFAPCLVNPFDPQERALRLLEEVAELCQACNIHMDHLLSVISRTYSREPGKINVELAQIGICLSAFASIYSLDLEALEAAELQRIKSLPVDHFTKRMREKILDMPLNYNPIEVNRAKRFKDNKDAR
jgi:hypothetical protein